MRLARDSNSQSIILGLNLLLLPCRGRAFWSLLALLPFWGLPWFPPLLGFCFSRFPPLGCLGFVLFGPLCFPPFGGLLGRFPVLIKKPTKSAHKHSQTTPNTSQSPSNNPQSTKMLTKSAHKHSQTTPNTSQSSKNNLQPTQLLSHKHTKSTQKHT